MNMTTSEHTAEPWHTDNNIGGVTSNTTAFIRALDSTSVCAADTADARRIVACVNALAGVPTEALEGGAVRALVTFLTQQDTSAEFAFISSHSLRAALAPFEGVK